MNQTDRIKVIDQLGAAISNIRTGRPLRVAVDGRTASGKTTFANELGSSIELRGREIIRTSIDGFHKPKVERYARGRFSAEGYYFDARDLTAIRSLLLDPLGPDGDRLYRTESFDLERDLPIDVPPIAAPVDAILIVDGTFLQRPELASGWDVVIFVRTSAEISESRGINRDAQRLGGTGEASRLYEHRYRPAFALYDSLCYPEKVADAVFANNDLEHPVVHVRAGGRLSTRGG